MIGVKNNTGEAIVGRFDGKDYKFQPGVVTGVPEEVATHVFGYGLDDKRTALLRLGWVANSTNMDDAIARLGQIQFLAEKETVYEEPKPQPGTKMAAPGGGIMEQIPTLGEAKAAGKK